MISMLQPSPHKCAAETVFGFSVEKLPCGELPAEFFQDLPERFSAAELPGYQGESYFQLDDLNPVHACSLIEPELLENLSMRFPGLVRDCITGLNRIIDSLSEHGIHTGVLNIDLSTMLSAEQEKLYLTILRGIAYHLESHSFTLLIPFSVPSASPEIMEQAVRFFRKTLLPWVKLRLDIHAHELTPGFSPEALAGDLFSEVRSIRFMYLADSGNVLIPEHIQPWLTALARYGFRGPCFFAPMASTLNGLPAWITANESLVSTLEKDSGVS